MCSFSRSFEFAGLGDVRGKASVNIRRTSERHRMAVKYEGAATEGDSQLTVKRDQRDRTGSDCVS